MFEFFKSTTSELDAVKEIKRLKGCIAKNCYNMYSRISKQIYGQTDEYAELVAAKREAAAAKAVIRKQKKQSSPSDDTSNKIPIEVAVNGAIRVSDVVLASSTNERVDERAYTGNIASPSTDVCLTNRRPSGSSSVFLAGLTSNTNCSTPEINDAFTYKPELQTMKPKRKFSMDSRSENSSDDEDEIDRLGPRVSVGVLGAALLGAHCFCWLIVIVYNCIPQTSCRSHNTLIGQLTCPC